MRSTSTNEPRAKSTIPATEYIQSLENGLAVIRCFDELTPTRTMSEVAEAVGLTRAAARRFLLTLEALGYMERFGRSFRLKPQILELGYRYLASQPWRRHAQRIVAEVAAEFDCGCAVGVLDRESVTYVAYASANVAANADRSIGTRLPAHATAIGRVLLAHAEQRAKAGEENEPLTCLTPFTEVDAGQFARTLETVREQGYAIVDQQLEIGLLSIGVPIRNRGGEVFAGLSISFRTSERNQHTPTVEYCASLRTAADRITAGLSI